MNHIPNDPIITLHLTRTAIWQICDGLHQRMLVWRATEQYLEQGYTDIYDCVEECCDPHEAKAIADWYEEMIQSMQDQVDRQTKP